MKRMRVWVAAGMLALSLTGWSGMLMALPPTGDYCSSLTFRGLAQDPDGVCPEVRSVPLRWEGGATTLHLHFERSAFARGEADSHVASISSAMEIVATRVGEAMSAIGGLQLQEVHLIAVDGAPAGDPLAMAEALRMSEGDSFGCPVLVFTGRIANSAALKRSLSHEMFHCVQNATWHRKTSGTDSRWWTEGSAEWFEDLAFPEFAEEAQLRGWIRTFRNDSLSSPLTGMMYANAVFFAWLGRTRIHRYISQLADSGGDQVQGAVRALDEWEYQAFAQDYVDGQIAFPSGITLMEDGLGAIVPDLGATTGVPGRDLPIERRDIPPLTLFRGKLQIAQGTYAQQSSFATRQAMFSFTRRDWIALPASLQVACGGRAYKVAGMSRQRGDFRFVPNPQATTLPPCTCPVGNWTIPADALLYWKEGTAAGGAGDPLHRALVSPGLALFTVRADGSAHFLVQNLRISGMPMRIVTPHAVREASTVRTYSEDTRLAWQVAGDQMVMNVLGTPDESIETMTLAAGSDYNGNRTRQVIKRQKSYSGTKLYFRCKGNELMMTTYEDRPDAGGRFIPKYHYPFAGTYVRQ